MELNDRQKQTVKNIVKFARWSLNRLNCPGSKRYAFRLTRHGDLKMNGQPIEVDGNWTGTWFNSGEDIDSAYDGFVDLESGKVTFLNDNKS